MFGPVPNESDYTNFLLNVVQIPPAQLPNGILTGADGAPVTDDAGFPIQGMDWVLVSLEMACRIVNCTLQADSCELYVVAVYNLAADRLFNIAPDAQGQTFFRDARANFKIASFLPGVVSSSGDQGTSSSYAVTRAMENFTLADLQNLKTPWGREYIGIAQNYGTLWGLS